MPGVAKQCIVGVNVENLKEVMYSNYVRMTPVAWRRNAWMTNIWVDGPCLPVIASGPWGTFCTLSKDNKYSLHLSEFPDHKTVLLCIVQ